VVAWTGCSVSVSTYCDQHNLRMLLLSSSRCDDASGKNGSALLALAAAKLASAVVLWTALVASPLRAAESALHCSLLLGFFQLVSSLFCK